MEAADRGFLGGLIYGAALLLVHELVNTHAKVSLGSFPPFLAVITTLVGTLLSAAGGRVAQASARRHPAPGRLAAAGDELTRPGVAVQPISSRRWNTRSNASPSP